MMTGEQFDPRRSLEEQGPVVGQAAVVTASASVLRVSTVSAT